VRPVSGEGKSMNTNVITVKKNKIKYSKNDIIFYIFVYFIMSTLLVLTAYPMLYILSASFSDRMAVLAGKVVLFPVNFSLEGYQKVFENKDIYTGYANTIFYTLVGTTINMMLTMFAAYAFSRKEWPLKKGFMFLFTFTMLFSGGMIPNYILMSSLKLLNTRWAMILPGALSVYNMIIARTFIQNTIPDELYEAAKLDGCDEFNYFSKVVIPLSKPIMAVLTLYYAVGHWNSYFNAFIYLSRRDLYPLQIILREILIENSIDTTQIMDEQMLAYKQGIAELLKYSLIVVSTAPILCVYPFLQKYFIKGVMIGSLKG